MVDYYIIKNFNRELYNKNTLHYVYHEINGRGPFIHKNRTEGNYLDNFYSLKHLIVSEKIKNEIKMKTKKKTIEDIIYCLAFNIKYGECRYSMHV